MRKILYLLAFLFTCGMTANAQLKVAASGNVGIGTSNPTAELVVSTIAGGSELIIDGGNSFTALELHSGQGFGGNVRYFEDGVQNWGFTARNDVNGNPFRIGTPTTSNQNTRLDITSNGVGINKTAHSSYPFEVSGNALKTQGGNVWAVPSDRRLKKDIEDFKDGLNVILKMHPVSFKYNSEFVNERSTGNEPTEIGIIAQEQQQIAPYMIKEVPMSKVEVSGSGDSERESFTTKNFLSYNGNALPYILVNAIQEQQEQIEDLKSQIAELTEALEKVLDANPSTPVGGHEINSELNGSVLSDIASLEQNSPNPFNETTLIKYNIPENATSAAMQIFAQNGQLLKTIKIDERGNGTLNLTANSLPSGNYTYKLIVDGTSVGTKTMVLTK